MFYVKNKKKIILFLGFLFMVFTSSIQAEDLKEQTKNQIEDTKSIEEKQNLIVKLPEALPQVQKNTQLEFEKLSSMVSGLKEKLDQEAKTLYSNNKIVIFHSNMLNTANVPVPIYQNFITYNLGLDLNNQILFLDTLYENKKADLTMACCEIPYEVLKLDGSQLTGVFKVEKIENQNNKVKIINFDEVLSILEDPNLSTLTIEINTKPYSDIFSFIFN